MGKMGCGYGSEFHLMRYLGYHRAELNRQVEKETGGRVLEWLDFGFDPKKRYPDLDLELKGVDFLEQAHPARAAWKDFWPQTGNVQNWDAVGRLQSGSQVEYLLVEAKGHVEELTSHCGASEKGGLPKIKKAFEETINAHAFNATVKEWLDSFYQYANRLSTLHFLLQHDVPARLIFVYFLGDQWPNIKDSNGRPVTCPTNEQGWEPDLKKMYDHLGLTGSSKLEKWVNRIFLPVGGPE